MKTRRISFAIVAVVVAMAFGGALAGAQTTFTFTQLDPPGSVSTEADDINSQGQIIGFFLTRLGGSMAWWAQRIISRASTSLAARLRTAKASMIRERWWVHSLTPPGRHTLL